MSIRSILREAIESDRSLDLGELLDENGFSDVAVEAAGEALLHYADMAPLAQAEALSPVVAAYHRQAHDLDKIGEGFEMSLDLPTVKVEFLEEVGGEDNHLDDDFDIDNETQNLDDDSTVDDLSSKEITLANRVDKVDEHGDEGIENFDRFGEGSMEHTDFDILSDIDVADVAPIVDDSQWSSVVKIDDASDADLEPQNQIGLSLGAEPEDVAVDAAHDFDSDIDFE